MGELSWGEIAQSTMRTNGIVLDPPLFHDVLRLTTMRKPIPIQTLGTQLAVEALDEWALLGTARVMYTVAQPRSCSQV
jgi:hypothetical protein